MIKEHFESPPDNHKRPLACDLCGNQELRLLYPSIHISDESGQNDRSIFACDRCHSYWSTLPASVGSLAYYRSKPLTDHLQLEPGVARFRRMQRTIDGLLGRPPRTILDVGCASGAFLGTYQNEVAKYGVEPSDAVKELLAKRRITWLGHHLQELASEHVFEVVTCFDVIEHQENPSSLLDALDEHVAPGGLLAINTGNIDSFSARFAGRRWLYYACPEHCSFFSGKSLSKYLSERFGLELVYATWTANQAIDFWYLKTFVRSLTRELMIKTLPRRTVRARELSGHANFFFFCDNMFLVFKKPIPKDG